jgi:mevalonate kinase
MDAFYSHGKFLITGEYLVLKGALALAQPLRFGQRLDVKNTSAPILHWKSFDADGHVWADMIFSLPDLKILAYSKAINKHSNKKIAETLQQILIEAKLLNAGFLQNDSGFLVETHLSFSRDWGLGSSSTLINNIARWAEVDAFTLSNRTLGGSGYDIACANSDQALTYQLKNGLPIVKKVHFDPGFKESLFFVYLNKKQNSREGIEKFRAGKFDDGTLVAEITAITEQILKTDSLTDFENFLKDHEKIIAGILSSEPVQKKRFPDYFGNTKILGAWGGDFILATGNEETPSYFEKKGYPTIFPYSDMVLK